VTETLEHTARRIAEQGRDALLARLRPAFEEAAAAHRDALSLDDEQLERMVQRAADRADGLQWRRALASVATEQLGIGLGEALSHPAVARAQAIVGAPSYEEALGALGAEAPAVPGNAPAAEPEADAEPEPADAEKEAPSTRVFPEPEPPVAAEPPVVAAEPTPVAAEAAPAPVAEAELPDRDDADDGAIRLRAVHLGGIANLAPAEGDLELHISSVGLDIVRGPEQSVLGRLTWDEIVALETPDVSGRFRRKRQVDAHLVIRSQQGSASFEIPGVSSEELREHLAPLLAEHH
jgi:hypothetical protein